MPGTKNSVSNEKRGPCSIRFEGSEIILIRMIRRLDLPKGFKMGVSGFKLSF